MYTTHFALCHSWSAAKCQTAAGSGGVEGNQVWNGLSSQVFIRGGGTPALSSWDAWIERQQAVGGWEVDGRQAEEIHFLSDKCGLAADAWVRCGWPRRSEKRWEGSRRHSQRDATCCRWQGRAEVSPAALQFSEKRNCSITSWGCEEKNKLQLVIKARGKK